MVDEHSWKSVFPKKKGWVFMQHPPLVVVLPSLEVLKFLWNKTCGSRRGGERRGFIVIPKEVEGRGWKRLALKFQKACFSVTNQGSRGRDARLREGIDAKERRGTE